MEDNKNADFVPEATDEELDAVSGGNGVPGWSSQSKLCPKGCGRTVPYNWVGPCPSCREHPYAYR